MRRFIRHSAIAIGYGVLGAALVLLGGYIYVLESRPDLRVWHLAELGAEYRADDAADIDSFADYQRLEQRLFTQLQEQVYARVQPSVERILDRYNSASPLDPAGHPINYNRSFELPVDDPVGGAVLLHGLSDSPYSMRALAQVLHQRGVWALALRMPGHGTAPSGLVDVHRRDFVAATRLAVRHVRERIGPDQPLYMVGYSNGAALAVDYSLAVLEGELLPAPEALVLLSPALAVSRVAAFAVWQSRLARFAGLEKLAWTGIQPEFDPYKYMSFTVNASDQIYRLTREIAGRIRRLADNGPIRGFPRTLAFQSAVDATVPPASLVDTLLSNTAQEGHSLVLFDVNRRAESEALLRPESDALIDRLLGKQRLPFELTLVTNETASGDRLVARIKAPGTIPVAVRPLDLRWPQEVFALSHVAIPFPPDDPLYGGRPEVVDDPRWITLGSVSIRGERGILQVPDSYFVRLRYNPFFSYLERRIVEFLGLAREPAEPTRTPAG